MDAFRTAFLCISFLIPIFVMLFALRSLCSARAMRADDWLLDTRVSIEQLLRDAKTGDMLLFSGYGAGSFTIKAWSWCPYSHCGMVIRNGDSSYMWNANVDESRIDAIQRKPLTTGGTQLNDLEVSVRGYDGVILWRPLSVAIPPYKINPILKDLSEKEFSHDYLDLLGSTPTPLGEAITYCRGRLPSHDDRYFCSELLVRSYQLVDALDATQCPLHVHPVHFTDQYDTQMGWKAPYRLGFTYLVETPASVPIPSKLDLIEEVPFFGGD